MKNCLHAILSLMLFFLSTLGSAASPPMTDELIWNACWSDDYSLTLNRINYPYPIHLAIHNISLDAWNICVFDKLCWRSLYQGPLLHNYRIELTACADNWGRGNVSLMNTAGEIWHFDATGDRVVTLK